MCIRDSLKIPAHERGKAGRKKLSSLLPRVEVVHDLPEAQKICGTDGTTLERIGEEISEQLDFKPAQARVIRHIRPKYACPCCRTGVAIAPVPLQLLPKSLATPALLAHIATAKFVDGIPLYRQEAQFDRLGVQLGRATMAGWMIKLGATHVVPIVNLLHELMLLSFDFGDPKVLSLRTIRVIPTETHRHIADGKNEFQRWLDDPEPIPQLWASSRENVSGSPVNAAAQNPGRIAASWIVEGNRRRSNVPQDFGDQLQSISR